MLLCTSEVVLCFFNLNRNVTELSPEIQFLIGPVHKPISGFHLVIRAYVGLFCDVKIKRLGKIYSFRLNIVFLELNMNLCVCVSNILTLRKYS